MGYINVLGSLFFTIVGWLILFQHNRLGLNSYSFLNFIIYIPWLYLVFQFLGFASRKASDIKAHLTDIAMSLLPLIVFLKCQTPNTKDIEIFQNQYLIVTLIDLIFITYLSFKIIKSQTHVE